MTPFAIFLICLGLVVLCLVVSILLTPSAKSGGESIGRGTRFFLVLLRLAIGWHFLTEGLDKLQNPAWSSESYLRGSTGPLADYFRGVADADLLAKLTVGPDGKFPVALDREWRHYLDTIAKEFELNPEQRQLAELNLKLAEAETLQWLKNKQQIKKLSPYVDRTDDMTVAERIKYYHNLVAQIDQVLATEVTPYGSAAQDKLKQARDEADYIIKDLKKDLAQQTEKMKERLVALPFPVSSASLVILMGTPLGQGSLLTTAAVYPGWTASPLPLDKQSSRLPPMPRPPVTEWTQLQWSDYIVPWALTIVGGLLIIGLLTRPACLLGAIWMLLLYLTMMPLPGWPEPARSEGHYLFINKNFIEMLALLVLATTRSGRWLGLDSLFALIFGARRRTPAPPRRAAPTGAESARPVSAS
jgi:uncharacterized membrane protein YphA (DoxX/SURF4 family)